MLDMIPAELHSTPQFLLYRIGGDFELHVLISLLENNPTCGIVDNSVPFIFQKQKSYFLLELG